MRSFMQRDSALGNIVHEVCERERKKERERERDRRKRRHHCRAEIGNEFTLSLAKN